jgi:hypothetical protein
MIVFFQGPLLCLTSIVPVTSLGAPYLTIIVVATSWFLAGQPLIISFASVTETLLNLLVEVQAVKMPT